MRCLLTLIKIIDYLFHLIQFCTEVHGYMQTELYVACDAYHLPVSSHTHQKTATTLGTSCPTLLE